MFTHLPLLTADQARGLLPGLSAAESQALAVFCAPASLAIERWCKHHLGYGSYVEYHRSEQTRKIYLKHPPILPGTVELRADYTQLGVISCVDPTATRATVSLTTSTMVLSIVSPSRLTPTMLTLSSYTTLADLAAAVNALAGWQCTVNQFSNWLVSDIEPNPGAMGAIGSTGAKLSGYVRDLSNWAMDQPQVGEIELAENQPQAFRFPDRAFYGGGLGYGGGGFRGGADARNANVRCSYQAGFDPAGLVAPPVPEDLQLAVALTIRAALDSGQFSGVIKSLELGNSKVEVNTPLAVPAAAKDYASEYVLRRL